SSQAIAAEIWREIPTLVEVLIASRAFLTIPALFIGDRDGRQNRKPLNGESDVCEVGDRAMSVLEVKSIEEFFRFLLADLLQRFLHRKRRPGVLRHGVGLNLGLHAVDRVYLDRGRLTGVTL